MGISMGKKAVVAFLWRSREEMGFEIEVEGDEFAEGNVVVMVESR